MLAEECISKRRDSCNLKCAISFLAGSVAGGLLVHLVEGSADPAAATLVVECPKEEDKGKPITREEVKAKEGQKPLPCMTLSKIKNPEGCTDRPDDGNENEEKEKAEKT